MAPAAPRRPEPAQLYDGEVSYVWSSLHRLGVSPQDLPDVAHDVFVTAIERLPTFDPSRAVRPWLFGICLRLVAASRRLARSSREIIDEPPDVADGRSGPDEQASARQEQRLVREALQILDLDRRAVVVLHDLEGTSVPEIAEALEIPLNTAYSRLRLGRAELVEAVRKLQGAKA